MIKAESIVEALIADLTGRKGFRELWNQIDPVFRDEIRQKWANIVNTNEQARACGLRSQVTALGRQLDREDNAAFNLWTWLPSFNMAEKYHGDYADEFRPYNDDVMEEAASMIGALKHGEPVPDCETCPCGEYCEEREGDDE